MRSRWGVLLGVFALCGAVGLPTAWAGPQDKRLDIYWIDVEGGAATLLVTPAGESLLIDSGNPGRRDADRIAQALAAAGLRQVDHLVTTHYHGDHYGGAVALSALVPIKSLYDNGKFEGMPDQPDPTYWDIKCEKRIVLNPGFKLPIKQVDGDAPALAVRCLGTRQKFVSAIADAPENAQLCAGARTKDRDGSDNANSVVLLVEFGGFRFFDAGDLTWNRETDLVCPKNLVGKVDVYQVTHHGLDASNNPLVIRSLEPTVAIMNNGVTKGCMPEVFASLKEAPSVQAVYQVHKNLRPDGATNNVADEYIANREKECKGNVIKLSVDPTSKTYTVGIPANKHERTYRTK